MALKHPLADMAKDPALLKGAPLEPGASATPELGPVKLPPIIQDKANKGLHTGTLKDKTISMSNALARGTHALTLPQKRLVSLALTKTDSWTEGERVRVLERGWQVTLTAQEYAEAYDVSMSTAYLQLIETSRSLMRTLWKTYTEEMRGNRKVRTRIEGPWLTLGQYQDHTGTVAITFHWLVSPHLLELRQQVTRYQLKQATALRSMYSWRLLECLKSWQSTGKWVVGVDEFAEAMDAPPSIAARYASLKQRVIDTAIKELREKGGMDVKMTVVGKLGKKVTRLLFEFKEIPLPDDTPKKKGKAKKAKGELISENLELPLELKSAPGTLYNGEGEALDL